MIWGLKLFVWVLEFALIRLEGPELVCKHTIITVIHICIYINISIDARVLVVHT